MLVVFEIFQILLKLSLLDANLSELRKAAWHTNVRPMSHGMQVSRGLESNVATTKNNARGSPSYLPS